MRIEARSTPIRVVINACFGGFSVSAKAVTRMRELGSKLIKEVEYEPDSVLGEKTKEEWQKTMLLISGWPTIDGKTFHLDNYGGIKEQELRTDAILIQVVEELGDEANGQCAGLVIIEIPNGVNWEISEYDGLEHIAETHRTWG